MGELPDGDMNHAQIRYLEAKRSVDERSRSRRVADRLFDALPESPTVGEAGAGTGTAVPWLLERGVTAGSYRGIDLSPTVIAHAKRTQPAALRYRWYDAVDTETGGRVLDIFDDLHARGNTLLLVTHERHVAERAERIVHVKDGELVRVEELPEVDA